MLNHLNTSRLFRLFVVVASVSFAFFFVYQTATLSSARRQRSPTITMPDHQPLAGRSRTRGRPAHQSLLRTLGASGTGLAVKDRRRAEGTLFPISGAIANSTTTSHISVSSSRDGEVDVPQSAGTENGTLQKKTEQNIHQFDKKTSDLASRRSKALDELKAILQHRKYQNVDEERSNESGSKKPVFVVILARMRTGSTMLGEIFNQNPNMFYMYEPLISLDSMMRLGELSFADHGVVSSNLLLEYSRCIFPHGLTENWLRWQAGNTRSTKLRPLCASARNCKNIVPAHLERACKSVHGNVCMKTIRADLDYFRPLVEAGINVKIIHLVRDPRGTTNSRRLYYMFNHPKGIARRPGQPKRRLRGKLDALGLLGNHPDYVVHTIPRLCQWTRDSVEEAQEKPAWLRNRYKLVRYEDFALEPLRVARDIYDFVGLEYPRAVMQWIVANTRSDDARSVKLFSTHKNSTETAMRWRHAMKFTQVRQVEELCEEAMRLLGYKVAPSEEHLANESVSLIDPLPLADFV
ncbi:carbohydrate sulfotransferase 1-like [Diadema setosum]|uniref:carbohydrate sulfotransferase 1-like n=1 Tax=Diadema setosum TaxID=31175 RepID=UPI003B3BDAC6